MKRLICATGVAAAVASVCFAVTTTMWEVSSQADFAKGSLHGVMISSKGEVLPGVGLTEHKTEGRALWAIARDAQGKIYVGAGNKGRILVLAADGTLTQVHETGEMAVTCFAAGPGGLYCGTMPGGKIFRIDAAGQVAEFADLEAMYVWALAVTKDGSLYAATGPEGKLFRVAPDGKAEVYFTGKDTNLLSLAVTARGELLCGSSESGLMYHVTGKDKARVLFDFPEAEVRSIAPAGEWIVVGTNGGKTAGGKPDKGADEKALTSVAENLLKSLAPEAKPGGKGGKSGLNGTVYRVDRDGRMEVLFKTPGEFIWQIAMLGDAAGKAPRAVAVATGNAGRIYRVEPEARVNYVAIDLEASQVMGMLVTGGRLSHVAAGNGAAVFTVSQEVPAEAHYLSKALDAQFVATWGKLVHHGVGRVTFQTRSGQTRVPDEETWSPWSGEVEATPFRVTSPRARYLQVRANLRSTDAVLQDFRVAYLVDNQRPVIASLSVGAAGKGGGKSGGKGGAKKSTSGGAGAAGKGSSNSKKIKWKAVDADGDALEYRLYYKVEAGDTWLPILPDDKPITKPQYAWQTAAIPDGRYRIKLLVSDVQANPRDLALTAEKVSEPVRVDNGQPTVSGLVHDRKTIRGRARDEGSVISHLSYSVDGGPWEFIFPADRLFDDQEESFHFTLNGDLKPGAHTVAVKALDAEGNAGLASIAFRVEP